MYQGTTPTLVLRVKNRDLTGATVFVSIRTGTNVITKTGTDLAMTASDEDTIVVCTLSQIETLKLNEGDAQVQIRFVDSTGTALATTKAKARVNDVLYKRVIEYQEEGT